MRRQTPLDLQVVAVRRELGRTQVRRRAAVRQRAPFQFEEREVLAQRGRLLAGGLVQRAAAGVARVGGKQERGVGKHLADPLGQALERGHGFGQLGGREPAARHPAAVARLKPARTL